MSEDQQRRGRRIRWLKRTAIGLSVLLCIYCVWHFSTLWQLSAEVSQLPESVVFSNLEPPPLRLEENGTQLILNVATLVEALPLDIEGVRVALNSPNRVGQLAELPPLELNDDLLVELDVALGKPQGALPLDYGSRLPYTLDYDCLQKLRVVKSVLAVKAVQASGSGDIVASLEYIERLFLLAGLLENEPLMLPQVVRVSMVMTGIRCLAVLVSHCELDEPQFAGIDRCLQELEEGYSLRRAVIGERASLFTTLDNISELGDVFAWFSGTPSPESFVAPEQWLNFSYRIPLLRPTVFREQRFLLQEMQKLEQLVDQSGVEASAAVEELIDDWNNPESSQRFFITRTELFVICSLREIGLSYRERIHTARLGIRVARHFHEHEAMPDSLADVLDESLPQEPKGLHTGADLIYKATGNAFSIYPVGSDGVDDNCKGGDQFEIGCVFFVDFDVNSTASDN